ncbi:MAG: hypothetical protein EKK56_10395 [Flavobacteriaceae bacterium]|nr:MAG: hypothetical protein EKK56_10395 [Flavobacteriaceae bacterium]
MKNYCLHLMLFVTFSFFAQDNQNSKKGDYNIDYLGNFNKAGMWLPASVEDKSISGSPYLFNSWEGLFSVINMKGNRFDLLNLNYNISTKKLESKVSKDSVFQYDLKDIDKVKYLSKVYKVYNEELFLQLFTSDTFEFLKSFQVVIQEAVSNPLTQSSLTPRRYVYKNEYKIFRNGVVTDFKLNKKSLLNLFPDKIDLIKNYANSNKLSFSEENDVVKIFNYIVNN